MRQLWFFSLVTTLVLIPQVSYAQFFDKSGNNTHTTLSEPVLLPGFSSENVASGATFSSPIAIAAAPDGRIFVAEKFGRVYIVQNGVKLSTPFIDLTYEVLHNGDRGIMGITLDPDFSNNHYVYLAYSVDPDSNQTDSSRFDYGRVTRYTESQIAVNTADLSSRLVLLGHSWADGVPNLTRSHNIDALRFAPDGTLLVSAGDGAHDTYADGGGNDSAAFVPGKLSTDQDVGAFRAQYLGSLAGKILRINPATGDGLRSNPFYDGDSTHIQSKIWAYGLRNPFRFSVRPGTGSSNSADGDPGILYIADCGWLTWEEIDVVKYAGQNFGWPCYESPSSVSAYNALSPTHSGCSTIGTVTNPSLPSPPLIWWNHYDASLGSPPGFSGICSIGSVFYTGDNYPSKYKGALFIADVRDWIKVVQFSGDSVVAVEPFAYGLGVPSDIIANPVSGDLYYVSVYNGEVRRIIYGQNGTPPKAVGSAGPVMGSAPLVVNFAGGSSYDPNGSPLTYLWMFGDSTSSMLTNPIHTFSLPGKYFTKLMVQNSNGGLDSTEFCISVGSYPTGFDVTKLGQVISFKQNPPGTAGTPDVNVIHDNIYPPVLNYFGNKYLQYDTYDGTSPPQDWIGYQFSQPLTFNGMFFQEGLTSTFGGWFATLGVEVRTGGIWTSVDSLQISPANYRDNGIFFEMFILSFKPTMGDAIRIIGPPGGTGHYFSIAELRAIASNQVPQVVAEASRTSGMRNLSVQFSALSSTDSEGDSLAFSWDFGDSTTSNESAPIHVYTSLGTFMSVLRGSDIRGGTSFDTLVINVLPNTSPTAKILTPADSIYYDTDVPVVFTAQDSDTEQPDSTLNISWELRLHHDDHYHPNWFTSSSKSFLYVTGTPENIDHFRFEAILIVSDSGMLADTQRVFIIPDHKPQFDIQTAQRDSFALQDSLYTLTIHAIDKDRRDSLYLDFLTLPSWLHLNVVEPASNQKRQMDKRRQSVSSAADSIGGSWSISGTPGASNLGDTLIVVRVTDLAGENDILQFPIHVYQSLVNVDRDWNIVSVPRRMGTTLRSAIFPGASSPAFAFHDQYLIDDTLELGAGYWLKFDSSRIIGINGGLILSDTVAVATRWNLIGALSVPFDSSQIVTIPPDIITSSFYGYDSSQYHAVNTLEPGKGYWVKVGSDGQLILHASTEAARAHISKGHLDGLSELNQLVFEDSRGRRQELHFGKTQSSISVSRFELPPVPPKNAFDVRFTSNSSVGIISSGSEAKSELHLSIQSIDSMISMNYKIIEQGSQPYFLTERRRGKIIKKTPLLGVGRLVIDGRAARSYAITNGALPSMYRLYQNYPNPFNPSTSISFDLPVGGEVSLKIFDVLGQEIMSLVDSRQLEAGNHSIIFDARLLPSGVYFYRLLADKFVDTRKLLLIR